MIKTVVILSLCTLISLPQQKIIYPPTELTNGSTLLAVITRDTVWMAADTKYTVVNNTNQVIKSYTKTKIYKTGNVFYGFTGASSIKYGNEKFDAQTIVQNFIASQKSFDKSASMSNAALLKGLNTYIDYQKQIKAEALLNRFINKGTFLDVMMVTFENSKLKYFTRSYALVSYQNTMRVIISDSGHYDNQNKVLLTGHRNNLKIFLSQRPAYFQGFNRIKDRLVCLIKIEAEKDAENVGMPVDVAAIYKNGYKWFLNNKDCSIR